MDFIQLFGKEILLNKYYRYAHMRPRKQEQYDLYWSNSTFKNLLLIFNTRLVISFTKNIEFRNQNVWSSYTVQLFLCEFDLVRLPNSGELNPQIELDLHVVWVRFSRITVWLGLIDYARACSKSKVFQNWSFCTYVDVKAPILSTHQCPVATISLFCACVSLL